MVRVLVVEDSDTVRALLVGILQADPELLVAGEAKNGVEAVSLTKRLRPDVISMDIMMPVMDGFGATKQIMSEIPTPIVLVTSNLDVTEAERSMHAMRLGALHAMLKPAGPDDPQFERQAREYRAILKTLAQVGVVRHWSTGSAKVRKLEKPLPEVVERAKVPTARGRIVAVAASTGGPAALQQLLGGLRAGFAAPVLVVQHICAGFVTSLAASLNLTTRLQVKVAEDLEPLRAGTVYLAPDGCQMGVDSRRVVLSDAPALSGFRPSATYLFDSVGRGFGQAAVGVILTGMGEDGVAGLASLRREGGYVLAQDQATSIIYGMPRAAVDCGVVDEQLPLYQIAARLEEVVRGKSDR